MVLYEEDLVQSDGVLVQRVGITVQCSLSSCCGRLRECASSLRRRNVVHDADTRRPCLRLTGPVRGPLLRAVHASRLLNFIDRSLDEMVGRMARERRVWQAESDPTRNLAGFLASFSLQALMFCTSFTMHFPVISRRVDDTPSSAPAVGCCEASRNDIGWEASRRSYHLEGKTGPTLAEALCR